MRGSGFEPVPPILIVSVFVFLLSYLVYKFVSLFTIVCLFAYNAAAAVVCLFVVVVYGGSILICLLFVCLFIVMVVLISKKNGKKCNSNRSVKIC